MDKFSAQRSVTIWREFVENNNVVNSISVGTEKDCLKLLKLLKFVQESLAKTKAENRLLRERTTQLEGQLRVAELRCTEMSGRFVQCQGELQKQNCKLSAKEAELQQYKAKFLGARATLQQHNSQFLDFVTETEPVEPEGDIATDSNCHIPDSQTTLLEANKENVVLFPLPKTAQIQCCSVFVGEECATTSHRASDEIDFDVSTDSIPLLLKSSPTRRSRSVDPLKQQTLQTPDRHSWSDKDVQARLYPNLPNTPGVLVTPSRRELENKKNVESWTRGSKIGERIHRPETLRALVETCDVCFRRFGFSSTDALYCVDCNIRYHRKCRVGVPMPCLPRITIPKNPKSKILLTLKHFCPNSPPMVPPILIRCVVALEKDRLSFEGIYRRPGVDSEVNRVFDELLMRVPPSFVSTATETITGLMKKFLVHKIRDRVVPSNSFEELMKAVRSGDERCLRNAVCDFPGPNRDTLAFLMRHLQNVAGHSRHNKMTLENLATVLAPTLIGYSPLDVSMKTMEKTHASVKNQQLILRRLLQLPQSFWTSILENNGNSMRTLKEFNRRRVPVSYKFR